MSVNNDSTAHGVKMHPEAVQTNPRPTRQLVLEDFYNRASLGTVVPTTSTKAVAQYIVSGYENGKLGGRTDPTAIREAEHQYVSDGIASGELEPGARVVVSEVIAAVNEMCKEDDVVPSAARTAPTVTRRAQRQTTHWLTTGCLFRKINGVGRGKCLLCGKVNADDMLRELSCGTIGELPPEIPGTNDRRTTHWLQGGCLFVKKRAPDSLPERPIADMAGGKCIICGITSAEEMYNKYACIWDEMM